MRVNFLTVLLLALALAGAQARARDSEPYEQPPINYSTTQPHDPNPTSPPEPDAGRGVWPSASEKFSPPILTPIPTTCGTP